MKISGNASSKEPIQTYLQYPRGMLIGSKLVFIKTTTVIDDADIDGRVYTIIDFRPGGDTGARAYSEITISPAMTSAATVFGNGDGFEILPFGTPPINVDQAFTDDANTSDETCKIDQFLGIASAITLPETKVDLKRFHVVGLGRDVSVQVPGKFVTEGGSFEVNLHTGRWLKYCLGKEAVHGSGEAIPTAVAIQAVTSIDNASGTEVGQSTFKVDAIAGIIPGDYILITDAITTSVVSDHEPGSTTWDGDDFSGLFDNAQTNEYRRVLAIDTTAEFVHLDEPLSYAHADNAVVTTFWQIPRATGVLINQASGSPTGYPADETGVMVTSDVNPQLKIKVGDTLWTDATGNTRIGVVTAIGASSVTSSVTIGNGIDVALLDNAELFVTNMPHLEHRGPNQGNLTFGNTSTHAGTPHNGITHLLYSKDTVPSFCLEVSQRRRDSVDDEFSDADGTSADSKELNRVYRGCKVKDWTLSTDNDAALKLAVNFDSTLCYTDTGRLEGGSAAGSRYTPHRMFDDTANNQAKRYISGIGKGSQKPFMFYNGTIKLAGQTIAQVVSFSLTGATGLTTHYAINGANVPTSSTLDQVPFAGSRNPAVLVEGQTEYSMDMEIIVDDPIFFHKMRTATEFTNSTANQIVLDFVKTGSGVNRERMVILIDDYYITEAPLQIPEDKGVVKSTLKVMPKAIKVVCRDSILKY